jgi:hypothetical protein
MTDDLDSEQPMSHVAHDRFFMMIFSAQRAWNRPKYTHTFATFVRARRSTRAETQTQETEFGSDPSLLGGSALETHTISWLAANKKVCLFRLWPEPGANFDLVTSLEWALSVQSRISMWGPFEIKPAFYAKALVQKARLESGAIQYKVFDPGYRPHIACSCIHGLCDVDQDRGPLWTWFRYGESASQSIAVYFLPWVIDAHQDHQWLTNRLDLAKYRIIYRQLPATTLAGASGLSASAAASDRHSPVMPTRRLSQESPTREPMVQIQAS